MFEDMGLDPDPPPKTLSPDTESDLNSELEELPPPHQNLLCLGHDKIEAEILKLIQQNALPHALIFAGPSGIGKATFAHRLIRFLMHPNATDKSALATVQSLEFPQDANAKIIQTRLAAGGHPDIRTIERRRDEKSGKLRTTLDLDELKSLPSFLRLTPANGGWRVAIIDEAETMNRFGQNALLKILEEPPKKALLILITRSVGSLIPTIRSRSRVFRFTPPGPDDIHLLLDRIDPVMPPADRDMLKTLCGGQIGQAQIYYENDGLTGFRALLDNLGQWPDFSWDAIHKTALTLAHKDAEPAYGCFRDGILFLLHHMVQAKAKGLSIQDTIAQNLDLGPLNNLFMSKNLKEMIDLYDRMRSHFEEADRAFLNRQQTVLNAYFKLKA